MSEGQSTPSHEVVKRAFDAWDKSCAIFKAYHPKPDSPSMLVDYHVNMRHAAMRAALEATMGDLVELLNEWATKTTTYFDDESHGGLRKRTHECLTRLHGESEGESDA